MTATCPVFWLKAHRCFIPALVDLERGCCRWGRVSGQLAKTFFATGWPTFGVAGGRSGDDHPLEFGLMFVVTGPCEVVLQLFDVPARDRAATVMRLRSRLDSSERSQTSPNKTRR